MIICCRKVLSSVKPGYLRSLLPVEAPNDPENWKDVMTDVEKLIMPGVFQSSSQYCINFLMINLCVCR